MPDLTSRNKKIIAVVAGLAIGCVTIAIINKFWWKNRKSNKIHSDESASEIGWSDIDANKINDIKQLNIEPKKIKGCRSDYISQKNLIDLLDTKQDDEEYILIDVRDQSNDFSGGHIIGSINISEKVFYNKISSMITSYNNYSKFIVYDMYGERRCIKCIEMYDRAVSELILNYSPSSSSSYYYKYILSDNVNEFDSTINLADDDFVKKNVQKTKIDVNNLDDNIINNFKKQELYVLQGGYFELINSSQIDIFTTNIIKDLDISKYEQLQLNGVYDKKMYYHKNEFFAKAKFSELKKRQKSANFKLNSSGRQ